MTSRSSSAASGSRVVPQPGADAEHAASGRSSSGRSSSGTAAGATASGAAAADAAQPAPAVHRHATLKYSAMRVGLFAVAIGLLMLVPVRGVLLVALALIISGLASYVLLGPQRQAMSAELFAARERRRVRAAQRAAREDHLQAADDDGEGADS